MSAKNQYSLLMNSFEKGTGTWNQESFGLALSQLYHPTPHAMVVTCQAGIG